ncbi:hypothetical protein DH2020_043696 [Rehmannia glutinosa]|uniref:PPM-type phosphatase domain-containing protein n=1 Tax=Rehmannia glutinosa TaxID=99300 RepID=A0ABR0UKN4_REHGL
MRRSTKPSATLSATSGPPLDSSPLLTPIALYPHPSPSALTIRPNRGPLNRPVIRRPGSSHIRASVSANTSTPITVLQFGDICDDATDAANQHHQNNNANSSSTSKGFVAGPPKGAGNNVSLDGFESTSSFSALPLQRVPRGGEPPSGPLERAFFMSGPIERGALSGPLDGAASSDNNGECHFRTTWGIYVKKRKKKSISGIRKALYRNFSVVPVRNFISGGGRKDVPPRDDSCREAAEDGCESNVQWALGKAGEDRVHVVVSEELGWLFVGIYDGFNGPDAPEFLMSHLYKAMYKELEGLFWDTEDVVAASENAHGMVNSYPSDVNRDDRQEFKERKEGEIESQLVKKVMFGGEQIEVRRRRLWEFLVEDDPEDGLDLSGSERFAFSVDDALSVNNAGSAVSRRSLLLSKLKHGLLNRHKDKEGSRLFPWRFWLEGKQKPVEEMRESNLADDREVERERISRIGRKRKVGACIDGLVLVGCVDEDDDVYVMNVGDSRAIVAQYEPEEESCDTESQRPGDGGLNVEDIVEESAGVNERESKAVNEAHAHQWMSLTALQLSTDHSTSIEESFSVVLYSKEQACRTTKKPPMVLDGKFTDDHVSIDNHCGLDWDTCMDALPSSLILYKMAEIFEVIRIKNEHPDDRNCIVNDRVKGRLKQKLNDALLEMFRNDYIGTAPYVSCSPSLRHHKLCPRDQFLVLSSDGLYQYFSNQEVVSHVQNFMERFPDGDPAQHLIEELLFRAARKAGMDFHELLDIPQGDRRKYHDDVTVMVVSLEGRIWKSSGKYL